MTRDFIQGHRCPRFGPVIYATFRGIDRAYWTKELREAEQELDAATTRTAVNAAAKKLQRAKQELKLLEAEERPNRRPSRGGVE